VIVLILSAAYIQLHGLGWMQAVFYGVGAAVIGIIARSAIKLMLCPKKGISDFVAGVTSAEIGAIAGSVIVLGRRTLEDWKSAAICVLAFVVVTWARNVPEPLLILAAAVAGLLLR
jgi:chromate transport protein ChrA